MVPSKIPSRMMGRGFFLCRLPLLSLLSPSRSRHVNITPATRKHRAYINTHAAGPPTLRSSPPYVHMTSSWAIPACTISPIRGERCRRRLDGMNMSLPGFFEVDTTCSLGSEALSALRDRTGPPGILPVNG